MKKPRYFIEEGGRIPRFYGVAYIDIARQKVVFYPIPLNILVNWIHKLYWKISDPSIPTIEQKIHRAYMKGKLDGWKARQKRLEKDFEIEHERLRKKWGWRS